MAQHPSTVASMPADGPTKSLARRRLLLALPAAAFAGLAAVFTWGLARDPSDLPSPLVGRAVPKFTLPPVKGRVLGLSSEHLLGEVSLVNVFASWCAACRIEHPLFMDLRGKGTVPIHGLNYTDRPEDAEEWLNTLGDPYTRTGADRDGRVGIDWGVYGVPETYVVGPDGIVRYKHIGPVSEQALSETILPVVQQLRRQSERSQS